MGAPAHPLDRVGHDDHKLSSGAQPHAVTQPVSDAAAPESVTHAVYLERVTVPGVVQAQPVALGDVAGAGIERAGLLFTACDVWPGRNAVESPA